MAFSGKTGGTWFGHWRGIFISSSSWGMTLKKKWKKKQGVSRGTEPKQLKEGQSELFLMRAYVWIQQTPCKKWRIYERNAFDGNLANLIKRTFFFCLLFFIYFFTLQYCIGLPYINMSPPWVYTYSQSWTHLPPHSPYHPSGSSQCTSPKL